MTEEQDVLIEQDAEGGGPEGTPKVSSSRVWIIIVSLLVIVVIAGTAWYYNNGPCGVSKTEGAIAKLDQNNDAFLDAMQIASSTNRSELAGPVGELQNILDEAEALEVPKCLEETRDSYVAAIDQAITGFMAFMAQEDTAVVEGYFLSAGESLAQYQINLGQVELCRPWCGTPFEGLLGE